MSISADDGTIVFVETATATPTEPAAGVYAPTRVEREAAEVALQAGRPVFLLWEAMGPGTRPCYVVEHFSARGHPS